MAIPILRTTAPTLTSLSIRVQPAQARAAQRQLARESLVSKLILPTAWTTPSTLQTSRPLHTTPSRRHAAPKSKDRGPKSEEDTQTDFSAMDILSNTPVPTTAIDSCAEDGFALNSGLKVAGSGVLLVGGEAFKWRPWAGGVVEEEEGSSSAGKAARTGTNEGGGAGGRTGRVLNAKGQLEVDRGAWGVLDLVWPKPDLLILGTGRSMLPLSPKTRGEINALGVRIEVQDTRNAAAQFNLLATERGVQQVAAALIPIGWRDGK